MAIKMIVAITANKTIGRQDGSLPFEDFNDKRLFRRLTTNHIVLMGRKTWESLPEVFRPLPKRHNIIVSKQYYDEMSKNLLHPEVDVVDSLEFEVLEALSDIANKDVYIIGGKEIYEQSLTYVDEIHVTMFDYECKEQEGDVKLDIHKYTAQFSSVELVEQTGAYKAYRFFDRINPAL